MSVFGIILFSGKVAHIYSWAVLSALQSSFTSHSVLFNPSQQHSGRYGIPKRLVGLQYMSWDLLSLTPEAPLQIFSGKIPFLFLAPAKMAEGIHKSHAFSSKISQCDWIFWFILDTAQKLSYHTLEFLSRAQFPDNESPKFSIFCNLDRLCLSLQVLVSLCLIVLSLICPFFLEFIVVTRKQSAPFKTLFRNLLS